MRLIKVLILFIIATTLLVLATGCVGDYHGSKATKRTNKLHSGCPTHLKR